MINIADWVFLTFDVVCGFTSHNNYLQKVSKKVHKNWNFQLEQGPYMHSRLKRSTETSWSSAQQIFFSLKLVPTKLVWLVEYINLENRKFYIR